MRTRFQVCLTALILGLLMHTLVHHAHAEVPDTYDWFEDADGYAEVIEIARAGKRPLIVYFHVDWCGYCKYLNEELLDDRDVDDYVSNFLRVKINPEDGTAERKVAQSYNVKGYPTLFVTFPHKEKKARVHPFKKDAPPMSPEQFIAALRKELEGPGNR